MIRWNVTKIVILMQQKLQNCQNVPITSQRSTPAPQGERLWLDRFSGPGQHSVLTDHETIETESTTC